MAKQQHSARPRTRHILKRAAETLELLESRMLLASSVSSLVGPAYFTADEVAARGQGGAGPIAVDASGGAVAGIPWTGSAGVTISVADLMKQPPRTGNPHTADSGELEVDRTRLKQNPDAPRTASSATGPSIPSADTPQTVSATNFLGASLADGFAFPPDTMGAIGPTQFTVCINNRIRTFNKSTGVADGNLNMDMETFFSTVISPASGTFASDPHIRYDRISGRWFVDMIDVPGGTGAGPNRIMIAVSSGSTISSKSSFTFYQFQNDAVSPAGDTNDFSDYPTLGIDNNALYIGVNNFLSSGAFDNTSAFVVRKSSITSGGPIVVTAFRDLIDTTTGTGIYTPQGVDNLDNTTSTGYFIGVDNAVFSKLDIRRITNPGGTPSISANQPLTVSTTAFPQAVPHSGNTGGTAGKLDALDDRLFAAVVRNGHLWTAHNIGTSSTGVASGSTSARDSVRWYDINNLDTTPTVNQFGTVFDNAASNPKFYFIPSLTVSGQNHVAVGFTVSSADTFVQAATVGRLSSDASGTMETVTNYTTTTSAYNPSGDPGGPRRWGDYSFTSVDPSDDMSMWTIQEYTSSTDNWGVRVAKLLAPPPATPSSTSPSSVAQGVTTNVIVTGTSSSGSGFFDPGAGSGSWSPNHITASVSGTGVTVNSVTYTNPTLVTLNITVAANAPTGTRTITVTNPDGQSTTSATGILTISAGAGSNGSIAGQVYEDRNGNGVFDGGEPTINGVSIALSGTSSGNTSTAGSGNYSFGSLADGTYSVTETLPAGYVISSTNPITNISISGGNSVTGQNFGDFPITYTGTSGNDTYNVSGTASQVTIIANATTYTIAKSKLTGQTLTFNMGAGDDSFTANLLDVTNALAVNGEGHTTGDSITLDDSTNNGTLAYTITNTTVTRNGGFNGLTYGTVEQLTIKTGTGNDSIVGSNGITTPTTIQVAGTDTMNLGADVDMSNTDIIGSGTFVKTGSAKLTLKRVRSTGLTVSAGKLAIATSGTSESGSTSGTSVVTNLTVTSPATLDLNNNDLIVRNGNLTTINNLVKNGYGTGSWNGTGITSGTANSHSADNSRALGIILASDGNYQNNTNGFSGQTVGTADVLVKYTYTGDTNLDGRTTFDDFQNFLTGFNGSFAPAWFSGDFNFNNSVTFDDFSLFLGGYSNTDNAAGLVL